MGLDAEGSVDGVVVERGGTLSGGETLRLIVELPCTADGVGGLQILIRLLGETMAFDVRQGSRCQVERLMHRVLSIEPDFQHSSWRLRYPVVRIDVSSFSAAGMPVRSLHYGAGQGIRCALNSR